MVLDTDSSSIPGLVFSCASSRSKYASLVAGLGYLLDGNTMDPTSTVSGSRTPVVALTTFRRLRSRTPAPDSSTIASAICPATSTAARLLPRRACVRPRAVATHVRLQSPADRSHGNQNRGASRDRNQIHERHGIHSVVEYLVAGRGCRCPRAHTPFRDPPDGWKNRTGNNVWAFALTVDEQHGIVYEPVSGPGANFYGGDRPGANLFGNTLVALDVETGKLKWYFQTVRHELWDYNLPPAPGIDRHHAQREEDTGAGAGG